MRGVAYSHPIAFRRSRWWNLLLKMCLVEYYTLFSRGM